MKFGVSFLPDCDQATKPASVYYQEVIDYALLAERLGLHYVKMTEHYLHPYGGYCPDPLLYLASIARLTRSIRLMTGCLLPIFHHPIQLASRIAMLDHISLGRLDIGFARAYMPHEFEAFGINMDGSREKFTQTIESVLELWTKDQVSVDTPYFKFEEVTIIPKTYQQPYPPVWGAAVNSRQSFSWLAENGFGLLVTPPLHDNQFFVGCLDLYRENFVARKDGINQPSIAISLPLIIDKQYQKAVQCSEIYCAHYMRVWSSAATAWQGRYSTDYPSYTGLGKMLRQMTPQTMREKRTAFIGDPASIIDDIIELREQTGIDNYLWQIDFGQQPREISETTLKLFAEKVMPYL